MRLGFTAVTITGRVRSENQDAIVVDGFVSAGDGEHSGTSSIEPGDKPAVFGVFDGLGGHAGGAVASRLAAMVVAAGGRSQTGTDLAGRLQSANTTIREEAQLRPDLGGMGTTAVVIAVSAEGFALASLGDSAAFAVQGQGVRELTTPDRTPDPRQEGAWLLTAALGTSPIASPHTDFYPVAEPVRLLLASDGLTDVVDGAAVRAALTAGDTARAAAHTLVVAALRGGAPDNVSVIVLDLEPDPG